MYGIHLNKPPHFSCLCLLAWRSSTCVTHPDVSDHPPPCSDYVTVGGRWAAHHTALLHVLMPPGLCLLRTSHQCPSMLSILVQSPRILLLNLLVKLGGSLWSAQESFRSGGSLFARNALPFSSSMPRPQSICDRGSLLRPLIWFPGLLCHLTHW